MITFLLTGSASPAVAVEVGCATAGYDGHSISEEGARKEWPSGFRPVAGMCRKGFLNGEIVSGDFQKVLKFYRANHPYLDTFELISPGGNLQEAIRIGKLFRKYLLSVEAPFGRQFIIGGSVMGLPGARFSCGGSECVCASACALIWFGGVHRSREVGLHRPRIGDPEFKLLPPEEATAVYQRVLGELEAYLREMEVPRPIIDESVATGSFEIRWVEANEDDLARPPSFAEWEDATCGHFTAEEQNTIGRLLVKNKAALTHDEALLLSLLTGKEVEQNDCQMRLRDREVDRLPSP